MLLAIDFRRSFVNIDGYNNSNSNSSSGLASCEGENSVENFSWNFHKSNFSQTLTEKGISTQFLLERAWNIQIYSHSCFSLEVESPPPEKGKNTRHECLICFFLMLNWFMKNSSEMENKSFGFVFCETVFSIIKMYWKNNVGRTIGIINNVSISQGRGFHLRNFSLSFLTAPAVGMSLVAVAGVASHT